MLSTVNTNNPAVKRILQEARELADREAVQMRDGQPAVPRREAEVEERPRDDFTSEWIRPVGDDDDGRRRQRTRRRRL